MSEASEKFSETFYSFLHESELRPADLFNELAFSLLEKARESATVKQEFFAGNQETILQTSLALARVFQGGKKLLVCGNGGSATDAQHIAVEFMHPITVGRKALPAICMNNDMAMITAVANDVNYSDVFVRQIIALGQEGDALLGISTSGNSENLLQAYATAQRMGLVTIGFAGNDGGKMDEMWRDGLLDFCLTVPTANIHRVQETHMTLYHVIWDLTHEFLQHPGLLRNTTISEQQDRANALASDSRL